jgi:membrane protein DedA with SNARE-associated domain
MRGISISVAATGVWLPWALFLGTFASEDLTCMAAGALVTEGRLGFWTASAACALGIFVSDLGLYALGRAFAFGTLRSAWLRERLPPLGGGRLEGAFRDHGAKLLFTSRFLPGTRLPLYLAAGAVRYPACRFGAVLAAAAVIWTPAIVGAAAGAGAATSTLLRDYARVAWLALPIALVCGWLVARVMPLLFTWRGRRHLRARLTRLLRWEYWPRTPVYAPVAIVLLVEALRRRTWFAFTACNPGIPLGGLALESKGEILDQLAAGRSRGIGVAPYERLRRESPLAVRLGVVERWLERGPVVLKPDSGERGQGVAVVRDLEHARRWLESCPFDGIVQRWIGGEEYGVVWRRLPGGGSEIRSIARKVPPALIGDGVHSLHDLILADARTAPMAGFHLARQSARLDVVPGAGERVALGELGTHCRGATFLDARGLRTAALVDAFDEWLRDTGGLDFGRFDVRAPSDDAFSRGESIAVLEFNGVTGEPAHVYQPGYAWVRGLVDLCSHWRAACATGATNIMRGHRPASLRAVLRLLLDLRRRARFEAPAAAPAAIGEVGTAAAPRS